MYRGGHGTSLSFISQERPKKRRAEGPLTEAIIIIIINNNNMKLADVEEEMRTHNLTLMYKKVGTLAGKRRRLSLFITDPEHHQHFLKGNQQGGGRP
ncbi:MAG: hypothetical protein ACYCUI_15855 [Vulcanimicrobiaceae bacterium]